MKFFITHSKVYLIAKLTNRTRFLRVQIRQVQAKYAAINYELTPPQYCY
ncbi:MAG: hypothetical protein ACI9VT_000516 [Psychroserpens sp.]|jgi:hypothetical protein